MQVEGGIRHFVLGNCTVVISSCFSNEITAMAYHSLSTVTGLLKFSQLHFSIRLRNPRGICRRRRCDQPSGYFFPRVHQTTCSSCTSCVAFSELRQCTQPSLPRIVPNPGQPLSQAINPTGQKARQTVLNVASGLSSQRSHHVYLSTQRSKYRGNFGLSTLFCHSVLLARC